MPLIIEGNAADVSDEPHGAVRLLLSSAPPNPSMHAPQYTLKGREPSTTASRSGKTKMGGAASSATISRTISSKASVNANLTPFPRREVIGRIRLDKSRRDLR